MGMLWEEENEMGRERREEFERERGGRKQE